MVYASACIYINIYICILYICACIYIRNGNDKKDDQMYTVHSTHTNYFSVLDTWELTRKKLLEHGWA